MDDDFLDIETGAFQPVGEGRIGRCRPDGEHAAGTQRDAGFGQAGLGIDAVVGIADQPVRAIVDIEQDGVIAVLHTGDQIADIAGEQPQAIIIEAAGSERRHRPLRPVDDLGNQFGERDNRL